MAFCADSGPGSPPPPPNPGVNTSEEKVKLLIAELGAPAVKLPKGVDISCSAASVGERLPPLSGMCRRFSASPHSQEE